jgi:NAD(P)-dependent dehydrogenase (short-subunit alcohol dehydrogenase family)
MISAAFSLSGKRALVAGDSAYWSRYIAGALAEAGADVAITGRNAGKLGEAADTVRAHGRKAATTVADLTKPVDAEKAVAQTVAELGGIDVLVNASDLRFAKPFLETSDEEWRRVQEVDLYSVVQTCRAAGKRMIEQGKGRIINVVSCLAERGMENGAAYCAAMGGVLQLTRVLDLEWAKHGITTNAIGTGWMSETEHTDDPQEEMLLKYLPLKRYSHPKDLGPMVVYFASDSTDFYSGQMVYVDGAAMSHL